MSRMARCLLVVILFSTTFSLLAQQQQIQLATITGELRLERGGFPPNRIEITLESRGQVVATIYSDDQGNFFFADLQPNLYRILIRDENFEPVEVAVAVNPFFSVINRVSISLRMRKTAASAGSSRASSVSGGNPNMVDPAEYTRYSKDAIKQFEQGVQADKEHKVEKAIGHYDKAVALAPEFYAARNNLGLAYLAKAEFQKAQQQFEEVIRANHSDTEAYFNLANVFLLSNRLQDASNVLEQGLNRQPNSAFGKFLLGSIYSHTSKTNEAERAFQDCLLLDPNLTKAHLALVNLYLRHQRIPEAIPHLKAFIKSSPDDSFAPKAKEVLKRLEKTSPPAPRP